MKKDQIAIVDIETTGFMPHGLIVEIGIVKLNLNDGHVSILYDSLVREEKFAEEHKESWIFGHSDLKYEDVIDAPPFDASAIQPIFDEFPATAYNKKFDFTFLRSRQLKISELDCPMLLSTNVCKLPGKYRGSFKRPTVEEAWRFFFKDDPYIEKHRGADDAEHEARIVYELYKRDIFRV